MTNHTQNPATTGIWADLYHVTMRSLFARSQYRGLIRTVSNPNEISTGGLGEWKLERMHPKSETNQTEYVFLTVLDTYSPRHHGDIGAEAIIAHMFMHVERGTQCTAADPMEWTEECKAAHWEAMNRMGWSPWKCDSYNLETGEWTDYATGNIYR